MLIVLEADANRKDPEAYGRLHRVVGLTNNLRTAWDCIVKELGTIDNGLKTIMTTGVTGYTNLLNVKMDLEEDGRVQLFADFQSVKRYWIVDGGEADDGGD